MPYILNNSISKSVEKVVNESYQTSSLDITSFTFSARSKTIAFEVRFNNPNNGEDCIELIQVPIDEFDSIVSANVQTFIDVRKACFDFMISKGMIEAGSDSFPA